MTASALADVCEKNEKKNKTTSVYRLHKVLIAPFALILNHSFIFTPSYCRK